MMENTRAISQEKAPCVWHKEHSPVTVLNELHHVIPQAWQLKKWGEVRLEPIPVCGTSHNTFHEALRRVINHNERIPRYCVGPVRDAVEEAIAWHHANLTPKDKAP